MRIIEWELSTGYVGATHEGELEDELNRLQVTLEATIAEKERCRKLAVEHSVNAAGLEQKLSMCENMKLAHEFEELLQTTSIPVAVEKLKGLMAVAEVAMEINKYFKGDAITRITYNVLYKLKQAVTNLKEVFK